MPASPPATLPPGYLLRNFRQVSDWVLSIYSDLLNEEDWQFQQDFNALPEPAQHLYLRLLTRIRPLIAEESLHYAEVPDAAAALIALEQRGFAERNPLVDAEVLLNQQTRGNLQQWFAVFTRTGSKKNDLIDSILQTFSADAICSTIATHAPYVRPLRQPFFQRLLLLFFGNGRQDLSEFIITELGHVRYEPYRIDRDTRYFQSRQDVDALQHYLDIRETLEDPLVRADREHLQVLHTQLADHRGQPELQRRHERILLDIARQLERLDAHHDAMQLYERVASHPSRERRARILVRQQRVADALALCTQILQESHHPEELEFAEQFGSRLARQHRADFHADKAAAIRTDTVALEFTGEHVETVAARAFNDEHHQCLYVENTLFCGLFGLLFWDIIFAPIPGAFHHPFQRGPKYLHSEFFYSDRKHLIDNRLVEMNEYGWQQKIWRHYESRMGTTNALVFWEALSHDLINTALNIIPAHHLQTIFHRLAMHPGFFGSGFPDLIRFSHNAYELIEVKAPNDRLQPNQRRWFRHFAEHNIPARLLNVTWIYPDE